MTIYTQAFLPIIPPPDEVTWTLADFVSISQPAYGLATTQRVRYGAQRWHAKIKYSRLTNAQRHLMLRFADYVSTFRAFWLTDPSATLRGTFPTTELLGASAQAGAFWTGNTNRTIATDVDGVRVLRSGATANSGIGLTTAAAVTANATYAYRANVEPGAGDTFSFQLTAGSTRFGTTYGTSTAITSGKRLAARVVPTASPMYANIADTINLNANWTQSGHYLVRGMSLCRAFSVDGGSGALTQTGNGIYVKDLPTSTAGLFVAGDMVEIIAAGFAQLVRLTENVDSDSSGKAFMRFEGALHSGSVANDLIVPLSPACLMCLTEIPEKITTPPGYMSDLELMAEEVWE